MSPQGGFDMGRGDMPEDMKAKMEDMRKEQESKRKKATKKLSKKMKKILDENQYNQWQDWENKRTNRNEVPVLK